ncbi:MAG: polynucleotide adenylyltransferase PcnB [Geobacteraceae bacterium]|nr:polynucleotide adenylyltransferase PcnB [Geobacteraceae bacterium]
MHNNPPVILKRSSHTLSRTLISPNALKTMYRLRDNGFMACLVGGSVRDLLIGRTPKDFDLATNATPAEIKKLFRNCRLVGRRFRLAHIHFKDEILELATFRKGGDQAELEENDDSGEDLPETHSHLQKSDEGVLLRDNLFGTPEEDAWRRDFTVNSLSYNIADFSIIDYTGGIEDLGKRIIRTIGDPDARFSEDPVRMIRAVRLSAQLDFSIEHHSWEAILGNFKRITLSSPARLFDELVKTLLAGSASTALELLSTSGILGAILPEFSCWSLEKEGNSPSKAAEWIDKSLSEGKSVPTTTLLAVLFGDYIQSIAKRLFPAGTSYQSMTDAAIAAFMNEIAGQLFIPQRTVMRLREILLLQQRMQKIPGKKPENVAARAAFPEALELLAFRASNDKTLERTLHWWQRLGPTVERAQPEAENQNGQSKSKRGGRRRRSKRRTNQES